MDKQLAQHSKFLSLILRHQPEVVGLRLDHDGWVDVAALLQALRAHGKPLDLAQLAQVVTSNDKQRFAFSPDGQRIRASQGHSVDVDLGLTPQAPPEILFHGTASRFLPAIREQGLKAGSRQHVHLSALHATAVNVGARHGKPVVLDVLAAALHAQGQAFFLSANGVWLTATVAPDFLQFPDAD